MCNITIIARSAQAVNAILQTALLIILTKLWLPIIPFLQIIAYEKQV